MLTAEVGREDNDMVVRIINLDGINGSRQEPGPLTWLNSARLIVDQDEDAVHCLISVDDPRGAFRFTVRRHFETGALIISTPYPGDGGGHMAVKQLQPGMLEVGHYDPSKPDNYGGGATTTLTGEFRGR